MNIGWVIAAVIAACLGVLYYRDRQRVLAIREKEAQSARKTARAAFVVAQADHMRAVTERAALMRDPKAGEWIEQAEGRGKIEIS